MSTRQPLLLFLCVLPSIVLFVLALALCKIRKKFNNEIGDCANRDNFHFRIPQRIRIMNLSYGIIVSAYFLTLFIIAVPDSIIISLMLGCMIGGVVLFSAISYYIRTRKAFITICQSEFEYNTGNEDVVIRVDDIDTVVFQKKSYVFKLKNGEQEILKKKFVKQFKGFNLIEKTILSYSK